MPVNPERQLQVYVRVFKLAAHDAPFWHGFDKHGLLPLKQFVQVNYHRWGK